MFAGEQSRGFAWRYLLALAAVASLVSKPDRGIVRGTALSIQAGESTTSKEDALKRALFVMRAAIDQYYRDNKK